MDAQGKERRAPSGGLAGEAKVTGAAKADDAVKVAGAVGLAVAARAVRVAMRVGPALGVACCALMMGASAGAAAAVLQAVALPAATAASAASTGTAGGVGSTGNIGSVVGGSNIGGRILFTQQAGGVAVEAELSGLPPGAHAMHIHAGSACGDGHAPGAHFDPSTHGGASKGGKAAGDLPSLVADQSGRAVLKAVLPALTVTAGAASVLGRTIMIHAHGDGEHAGHAGHGRHGGHNHAIACAPIRALR